MIAIPEAMPVAILAGGLATRLRPITETIPKSLVEVAGKPFLAHQINQLTSQGLNEIVLCVGHLGEMIQELFGDGSAYGVKLHYSFDGPTLLGTGGALRQALPMLGKAFYTLYGDSYLPVNFMEVGRAFLKSGHQGLMTVYKNSGQYDTSNVEWKNGEILMYDKRNLSPSMQHIDYGLGLFRTEVFASIATDQKIDLADIMEKLLKAGELDGFEVKERFYEIGSHSGLAELNELLSRGKSQSY